MCDHPSIIKLLSTFQTKNKLFFVLEFAQNKDLDFFIRKFGILNDNIARIYSAEIINVIDYLHNSLHISHRDIKPSNILLDENFHIKFTDFSTCKIDGKQFDMKTKQFVPTDEIDKEIVGTAEYCSPEMLNQNVINSFSNDIWSFGCILYQFYHGKSPFKGLSEIETFANIKNGKIIISELIPKDAKDLIQKCLNQDQKKRISAKEIKNHPYFKKIDWSTLVYDEVPLKKDIFDKFSMKLKNGDSNTCFWNNFCKEVNGRNLIEYIVENFSVFSIIDEYFEKPSFEINFSGNQVNLIYESLVIKKQIFKESYFYLKLYSNKILKCVNCSNKSDFFILKITKLTSIQFTNDVIIINDGNNKITFTSTISELLKWYNILISFIENVK